MANKKTIRVGRKGLTSQGDLTKVQDVKGVVRQRMKELGMGPYDLAKLVKGKVTPQTVYNFTKGGGHMSTKNLPHLLAALRLELRAKD